MLEIKECAPALNSPDVVGAKGQKSTGSGDALEKRSILVHLGFVQLLEQSSNSKCRAD